MAISGTCMFKGGLECEPRVVQIMLIFHSALSTKEDDSTTVRSKEASIRSHVYVKSP
jgi:hypothetical protein